MATESSPSEQDATSATSTAAGTVDTVRGEVFAVRADGARVPLRAGDPLYGGDGVETGPAGSVGLRFEDHGGVALGGDSRLDIAVDPDLALAATHGLFVIVGGSGAGDLSAPLTVTTPHGKLALNGAQAGLDVDESGTRALTMERFDGEVGTGELHGGGSAVTLSQPHELIDLAAFDPAPATAGFLGFDDLVALFKVPLSRLPLDGTDGNDYGQSLEAAFETAAGSEGDAGGAFDGPLRVVDGGPNSPDRITNLESAGPSGSGQRSEASPTTREPGDALVPPVPVAESPVEILPPLTQTVIRGGSRSETLVGGEGSDLIVGGARNDTLNGGDGDDVFLVEGTGDGFDRFFGGDGTDWILGGDGDDAIGINRTFGPENSVEVIDGGGGENVLRGTARGDTLDFSDTTLIRIDEIQGGRGKDTITGSAGDDTINGGVRNDVLDGGAGDDVFRVEGSGDGFDRFIGGAGLDRILGSDGDDLIGFNRTFGPADSVEVIDGGAGVDVLRGTTKGDSLDFSATDLRGIEEIQGGRGKDTITGSAGNDVIVGGVKNDTMAGGGGDDMFLFQPGDGTDTITDFGAGDTLRFEARPSTWRTWTRARSTAAPSSPSTA